MVNLILAFAGFLFGTLLCFLLAVFTVFVIALFKKENLPAFEPKVSVVIPAYNESEHIVGCIESVLNSKYPKGKLELIVVDDGSIDDTLNRVRKIHQSLVSMRLVKLSHAGKSRALNAGIKIARNDLVLTLDADTLLDENCIRHIVKVFADPTVAGASANCRVKESDSPLRWFQNIEYHYNNLISSSFSKVFNQSMWFFGAVACYRKPVLEEIGFFKRGMLAEDMNVSLEIVKKGYKTLNVSSAVGRTSVPSSVIELAHQRYTWSVGGLQAVFINRREVLKHPATVFLAFTQVWGAFYSVFTLPVIAYLIFYWLPFNVASFSDLFMYLFRWFTLYGTFFVIYMIPKWGMAYYTLFAILSGLISVFMIVCSILMWKDKSKVRNAFAIFFYFPYTLLLNAIVTISMLKLIVRQKC